MGGNAISLGGPAAGAASGILMLKSPSMATILNVMMKKTSSWKTMSIIGVICSSILSPPLAVE